MMATAILFAILCVTSHALGQEVETKTGKIKGTTATTVDDKKVNIYLAIPYAEPPVGPLRFQAPKPKAPWADVLVADKQPPLCTQIKADSFSQSKDFDPKKELEGVKITGGAIAMGFEYEGLKDSEDCLFLNIFQPADAKPDSKLGVLLWIHGGAFMAGGIGIPSFDGSILATQGNVIVVTVQYRLGVYGFLHAATPEIPGNMGLRDMVEAMKWTKENIGAFGGNPDQLTLFGGNSGGWSAGFMLMSPIAKPYFKRSIMQSGSMLAPLMLFGEVAAKSRFVKFAKAAGCKLGDKPDEKALEVALPETYECLSKLTPEAIDKAQAEVLSSKKDSGFLPSEDTTKDICFFCKNPFDFVKDDKFDQTEILLGTNSNEGGMFLSSGLSKIYPPFKGEPEKATLPDLVEYAKKNGAGANAGQMQMMLPMFFRGVDKKDPEAVRQRLLDLIRDGLFVCPDQLLVNAFAKTGNAWYYRFDYRPSKSYWNSWLTGSLHMDEVQFVWGCPLNPKLEENYSKTDKKISKYMMKIWSSFATNGNPAADAKWKWKPCSGKDKFYLLISKKTPKGQKGFPENMCSDLERYYSMGRSFLKNYKA
ncbi:Acetylcholinesterase [Halotydeus destructor]|nr:Acetylcholinesterase [Halotydeus destructor]